MDDARSFAGADLEWVRSGYLPAAYSLRWNGAEVGSLRWESLFSSRALASFGQAAWRIQRSGWRSCTAADPDTGEPAADMTVHPFGSAELALADGRSLSFRRASLLPPAWSFVDSYGSPIMTLRGRLATVFRGGVCHMEPAAAEIPEAGLVALLGIYTLVRRARRRARH